MNLLNLAKNEEKIYFALNNPIRSWIIELLKSYNALNSSDLANLLHISLSRCCYHLDNLNDLVKQDNEQRYYLSKQGIEAYQLLVEPEKSIDNIVKIMK